MNKKKINKRRCTLGPIMLAGLFAGLSGMTIWAEVVGGQTARRKFLHFHLILSGPISMIL